ncbi:Mitochondrial import inner membrane translocase subunit TIM50 [Globomyces sp. JEL0801]|nr:Mitochondrial import inner membrane translocase subunit TIM50 [Globomyces sp. JEL0801]
MAEQKKLEEEQKKEKENKDDEEPKTEPTDEEKIEQKSASNYGFFIFLGVLSSYLYAGSFLLADSLGFTYDSPNLEGENAFFAHNRRVMESIKDSYDYLTNPPTKSLLPPLPPQLRRDYTLCLELTDALTHLVWEKDLGWRVAIRPEAKKMLLALHSFYELVIFTNTPSHFAKPVIAALDPFSAVTFKLYREHHRLSGDAYLKDLEFLNRDLSKVIVVDVDESCLASHRENGLLLKKWTELYFYADVHKVSDIRTLLNEINKIDAKDISGSWQKYKDQLKDLEFQQHESTSQSSGFSVTGIAKSLVGGFGRNSQALRSTATISDIERHCKVIKARMDSTYNQHLAEQARYLEEQEQFIEQQKQALKNSDLKLIDYIMGNGPNLEVILPIARPCEQCPEVNIGYFPYLYITYKDGLTDCYCGKEAIRLIDCDGAAPNPNFPWSGSDCNVPPKQDEKAWYTCILSQNRTTVSNLNALVFGCAASSNAVKTLPDGTLGNATIATTPTSTPNSNSGLSTTNLIIIISVGTLIVLILFALIIYLALPKRKQANSTLYGSVPHDSRTIVASDPFENKLEKDYLISEPKSSEYGQSENTTHTAFASTLASSIISASLPEFSEDNIRNYIFCDDITQSDGFISTILDSLIPLFSECLVKAAAPHIAVDENEINIEVDDLLVIESYESISWVIGSNKTKGTHGRFPMYCVSSRQNVKVLIIHCAENHVTDSMIDSSLVSMLSSFPGAVFIFDLNVKLLMEDESAIYPVFTKLVGNERCFIHGSQMFTDFLTGYLNDFAKVIANDFMPCTDLNDGFTLGPFITEPNPIISGRDLTVTVKGTLTTPIVDGAEFLIMITNHGTSIYSIVTDFCSISDQDQLPCPVAIGDHSITHKFAIPKEAPAVINADKSPIACIVGNVSVE